MQSVIFEQFGEPATVLTVRDIETPRPGRGEVIVRMLASPINPSDLMTIRGVYGQRPQLPATPGYEGVGIVESGNGLFAKMLVGKRVAVLNRGGGNWASYAVVPAKQCVPIPKSLPVPQAAMFFVNPATAYVMTRKVLAIPKGAWMLQTAAGSSLGKMVIRLGQHYGFKTLNIVRRSEQADELHTLGGDASLVFDSAHDDPADLAAEIRRLTHGEGVKHAIDPVGGAVGSAAISALAPRGRLLIFGTLAGQPTSIDPRELLTATARIEGFWLAKWFKAAPLPRRLATVRKVASLMKAGVLVNDVGRRFRLDEIGEAVAHSETAGRGGKAWLKIGDD